MSESKVWWKLVKLPNGDIQMFLLPPPGETNWLVMTPEVARQLISGIQRLLQ